MTEVKNGRNGSAHYRLEYAIYINEPAPIYLANIEAFGENEKGISIIKTGNKWQIQLELPDDVVKIEYKYIATSADPYIKTKKRRLFTKFTYG